jgi:hypothetical protein
MKSVKIPIKVGSHSTVVNINNDQMNCAEFIRVCLLQCGVVKNVNVYNIFKQYSLIERQNGIEVIIDLDENVCNLWAVRWSATESIQLLIKKFQTSKKLSRIIEHNQRKRRRESEIREERLTKIQYFFGSQTNTKLKRLRTNLSEDTRQHICKFDFKQLDHHYEEIRPKSRNKGFLSNLKEIFIKK